MKLLTTLFLALALILQAETLKLIENGKPVAQLESTGNSWEQSDSGYTGKGTGQTIQFPREITAEGFELDCTLSIAKLNHSAAGISFGSQLFGLDGRGGFFLEGGCFPKKSIAGNDSFITPGKPFHFKATVSKGKILFTIDGEKVIEAPFSNKTFSGITIRPHRGELSIQDLVVTGTFKQLEKLNFVFACGTDGYKSYRIPAIVSSKKGTLLAFAEGRVHHSGDHGNIDNVLKRSFDGGKTWQPLQVVTDDGKHTCGNAAPVVDQKSGRIFLVSCGSHFSEGAIMAGKGPRNVFIQHSDDDGETWTEPRDISKMVTKKDWRWYATGPCSGIQIREGKYKGRLIIPANHSVFIDGKNIYRAHCIYSDDLGKTWEIGESAGDGSNESQIAEAEANQLYHNMRMQSHSQGMRSTRYSKDGGKNWSDLKHDAILNGPRCQGSVIRDYSKPRRLIFSNPATLRKREGMTIRVSENGGRSWPYRKLVWKKSSAYSDLVMVDKDTVGILFECGHRAYAQEGILFRRYSMDALLSRDKTAESNTEG